MADYVVSSVVMLGAAIRHDVSNSVNVAAWLAGMQAMAHWKGAGNLWVAVPCDRPLFAWMASKGVFLAR